MRWRETTITSARARRRGRLAVLGFALSCLLPAAPHAAAPSEFVSASGNQLKLDGKTWRAVGVNFWDMDAARVIAGDFGGCYYQHIDLDAYFDSSFSKIAMNTGATAVRTFAFMQQYTGGANPDWSTTDKLLHYARKYNVRVIPVLGQQYGICGETFKTPAWYHCPPSTPGCTPGYKQIGPWGIAYRDYVVSVAARYKNDPTIAFWQLMNEAWVAGTAGDPYALADFAADMAQAIRVEAGDVNHLVSAGTVGANAGTGNQLEAYHHLLECPSPCMDLASAHYYGAEPLQGMPAQTALTPEMIADTANPRVVKTAVEDRSLQVDGWRTVEGTIWDPRTQQPRNDRTWAIRISGVASTRWSIQIDHVVVTTSGGPRVYEFENGNEGFGAQNGTIEPANGDADTGFGSLRVEIADPSTGTLLVSGPETDAALQSVSLRLRANFTAPLAQAPNPLALSSYLHEATVVSNKPFVATELGAWQEVSPFSPDGHTPSAQSLCADRGVQAALVPRVPYSAPHRALILDAMLAQQFTRDHASSGALVWDWKDPAMLVTRADGMPMMDAMLNCFTITPGDPTEAILKKWASQTPNPQISPEIPPGPGQRRFVGLPGPSSVKAGAAFALKGRVTDDGDPDGAIRVEASGGCTAFGPTDSLGHANVVCRIPSPGTYTISLSGGANCACTGSRSYTIIVVP